MIKKKLSLILLFGTLITKNLLATRDAKKLVLSGKCRKVSSAIPLNINSVNNPTYEEQALYHYEEPKTQLITPIVKIDEHYHCLLENGVAKTSYLIMRDHHLKEARKRLACLSIVIGVVIGLILMNYSEFLLKGFSEEPVFWG